MGAGSERGRKQYNEERIQGAVFFDLDEMSDKSSQYDHMLPSAEMFGESVGKVRLC